MLAGTGVESSASFGGGVLVFRYACDWMRATFLHPGNSRVPLFHTLCEDKRALKENGSAGDVRELGGYLAKGTDAATGQVLMILKWSTTSYQCCMQFVYLAACAVKNPCFFVCQKYHAKCLMRITRTPCDTLNQGLKHLVTNRNPPQKHQVSVM